MERYKVELLQPAYDEIDGIFDYIFLDSPDNAAAMVDRIFARLRQLERFPESGTKVSDKVLKKYGFRTLVEEPYIIFYNLSADLKTVYIHHVLHGARDWLSVLKG
ncbi:MAG: type II toxin-antitoxin system RelE/ParE family toxin [Firmicutes bacterium]|nr:type II toxin-antitoxin system RelE/ParE family toxin [Bacillota bacterium]